MILIGEKNENIKYVFRETVFGICLRNEELYLTQKGEDISLIGGGIESNETEEATLKREDRNCRKICIKRILYTNTNLPSNWKHCNKQTTKRITKKGTF